MADIGVTMGIDNKQALKALDQVKQKAKDVGKEFIKFDEVLGGLALAAVIQQSYALARGLGQSNTSAIAANKAVDQTSQNFMNLKLAILEILKPLNDFIATVKISKDQFLAFWEAIKAVGFALGTVFLLNAYTRALNSLFVILNRLGGAWKNLIPPDSVIRRLNTVVDLAKKAAIAIGGTVAGIFGYGALNPETLPPQPKPISPISPFEGRVYGPEAQARMGSYKEDLASSRSQLRSALEQENTQMTRGFNLLMSRMQVERKILDMNQTEAEVARAMFDIESSRLQIVNRYQDMIKTEFDPEKLAGLQGMVRYTNSLAKAQKDAVSFNIRDLATQRRLREEGLARAEAMEEERLAIEEFVDAKKREYVEWERSRLAITGWNQAWQELSDEAGNNAKVFYDTFNTVISSLDNAIDNFVRGTRSSFKDMFRGIIQDLLASGLKSALRQVLITSGAKGFFESTFAGFFAEGGYIPAGQYGVVGERGPELVSGPAQVTPMNGGGSIINNYISAVDAKSVAQLFAENRKTLLGVTEQAKKELNYKGMM